MHFHIKSDSAHSTILRTIIFTFGHYWIDVLSTHFIAGASLHLAMVSCIVGPLINAVWYFVLDRVFFSYILVKINKRHQ